jgi:hypothetical protein
MFEPGTLVGSGKRAYRTFENLEISASGGSGMSGGNESIDEEIGLCVAHIKVLNVLSRSEGRLYVVFSSSIGWIEDWALYEP